VARAAHPQAFPLVDLPAASVSAEALVHRQIVQTVAPTPGDRQRPIDPTDVQMRGSIGQRCNVRIQRKQIKT